MTHSPDSSGEERLVSWKRIAQYLQCSERTARRRAAEDGLPVHRHTRGPKGSVFAYRSELDAWLKSGASEAGGGNGAGPLAVDGVGPAGDVTQDDPRGPAGAGWISNEAIDRWRQRAFHPLSLISGIALTALSLGTLSGLQSCGPGTEDSPPVAFGRIKVGEFDVNGADASGPRLAVFAESLSADVSSVLTENNIETVAAGTDAKSPSAEFRLTGEVEKNGENLIARIYLRHNPSRTEFWSQTFKRNTREAFRLRDQVSAMTAAIIGCMINFRADEYDMASETVRAYLNFCDAATGQPFSLYKNLTTYSERILRSNPDSPKAMALHAYVLATTHTGIWKAIERQRQDRRKRARTLAKRALKRDPDNRIALTTLALVLPKDEITLGQREHLLQRAMSGGWPPNMIAAGRWTGAEREYARLLRSTGRLLDALVVYRNMLHANPNDVFALVQTAWDGAVAMRAYDHAGELLDRAERLNPDYWPIYQRRLEIDLFLHDPGAALAYLKGPLRKRSDLEVDFRRCLEVFAQARMSTTPDVKAVAAACATAAQPDWRGRMFACLGDINRAYTVLDPPAYSSVILFWPCMKTFRHDPHFFQLAAKFGLVDYWLETDKWPDFCREKDLPFACKKRALAARRDPANHQSQ